MANTCNFYTFYVCPNSRCIYLQCGPLGPVRKILVVRSGPEGPQFARSVGTLVITEKNLDSK